MDAKLKALKVVHLKDILAKAAISVPSKANKQDLIARILAAPAALEVYHSIHSPPPPPAHVDEPRPPPEEVAWIPEDTPSQDPSSAQTLTQSSDSPKAASEMHPALPSPPNPFASTSPAPKDTSPSQPAPIKSLEDEELEKHKARAARFGLPLVEPSKTKPASTALQTTTNGSAKLSKNTLPDDPEKLAARGPVWPCTPAGAQMQAQTSTATTNGKKRGAPPIESIDAEELERRRKRAERFRTSVVGTKV